MDVAALTFSRKRDMATWIRFNPMTILLLAGACVSQISHADDQVPPEHDVPSKWGLGVGVAVAQQPYRDIGNWVSPFPLVSYENSWIRVFGNALNLKMLTVGDGVS